MAEPSTTAAGDDAAAAGMPIVPGNTPANTLDTELNITRDLIVTYVKPVSTGGTGGTTPEAAVVNLGLAPKDVASSAGTLVQRDGNKAIAADYAYLVHPPALPQHATNRAYVDARLVQLLLQVQALRERLEKLEKGGA